MSVGEYGVPKRWYFLFTKSYWCSKYNFEDSAGISRQNIELEFSHGGNVHFPNLFVFCIF